ncbi:hypothetical protein KRM28CT15_28970 [Krasilnikovia sp. M28-CT-15]
MLAGGPASMDTAGKTLLTFACASMVGTGLVLLSTTRKILRAALFQAVPPALALFGLGLAG